MGWVEGLERSDFYQFLLWEDVVVLKVLISNCFHFGLVVALKELIFNSFHFGRMRWTGKKLF